MKLLIVGPDIRDRRKVKNFTGVQAYYIARELRARGIELQFVNNKHPDPIAYFEGVDGSGCDHALALGLRWFTHQEPGCAAILKSKVKGAVAQLHDGLVHENLFAHMQGVDCTFTFRDDSGRTARWEERYAAKNCYIGWAADPDLLFPGQNAETLRILIDHPYYKSGQPDITEAATVDVMAFVKGGEWSTRWKSVLVRRLVNGGAEDVNAYDPMLKTFDRHHVPFEDIASEYRKAHVYVATHKESVGLTCLELAMCGAIVLASKGLIYQDRLDTMRHILYEGNRAPWNKVLKSIDIDASAKMARKQRWPDVVDRMLKWFGDYK